MIFIVDFGSQTTHLIGRRIRDLGVTSEIVLPGDALSSILKLKPKGIILYKEGRRPIRAINETKTNTSMQTQAVPILIPS